jgi:tetratricopeptide (TPR) repeat protein/serine/threonine protein kinase
MRLQKPTTDSLGDVPMQEQTIFIEALELADPAARAAFLDRACGADRALRQRVERLLQRHQQDDSFMASPAIAPAMTGVYTPAPDGKLAATGLIEGPGTVIGPYKLLQQLGEGGMGTVYMAEQTRPVQRMAALKIIKPGMDSDQVIARFEAERQALALMDHPSIAKVLDAGTTETGRPYFVMELVKGVPITKYCDERRLPPRARLELFIPVCQAVQHAHQKGIIHRDLKPSNVLIGLYDDKPVPKVIDFGIAKATGQKLTDRTMFTEFGQVVGTLEYMSPEQAGLNQLDIDTRSDIYSLGVLLYELLTGSTPLERKRLKEAAVLEVLRLIREEEPPKPSTRLTTTDEMPSVAANRGLEPKKLSGLVRGDLDWVVMKALEKDRNRRYETANCFALDVQRYLADEPVQACPPSVLYRWDKFARRHRTGVLTTAAALLVGLLAAVGVGWVWWDRAAQEASRRLEWAERLAETDRTVSVALAGAQQWASQAEGRPTATRQQAEAVLGVWGQAEAALAEAEAALRTGAAEEPLRQRALEVRRRLEQGRLQTEQRRALRLRQEKLLRALDEARQQRATPLEATFDYAGEAAQYQAAFAGYGLAVEPGRTAELARRIRAEEPAVREALLVALDDWAFAAKSALPKASVAVLRELADAADDDVWRKRHRAANAAGDPATLRELSGQARKLSLPPSSLGLLAWSLHNLGERNEAVALLRWARGRHPADFWLPLWLGNMLTAGKNQDTGPVDLEERIGCYRVAVALRPDAGAAHLSLGIVLHEKGQPDDAIAEFRAAIDRHPGFALAHYNLGNALKAKGELDDAIAAYREAIKIYPRYALAHHNLGIALNARGRLAEAIAAYHKAIESNPNYVEVYINLGLALKARDQLAEALACYLKAIKINPNYVEAHINLGNALMDNRQLDNAIAAYHKAIDINPKHDVAHYGLGSALHAKRELDAAIAEYREAIAINPRFALAHNNLGLALKAKGEVDAAIAEYKKAIAADPKDITAQINLGIDLCHKGDLDAGTAAIRKAIAIDPRDARCHMALADALVWNGRFAEAKASNQQALKRLPGNHPLRPRALQQQQRVQRFLALEAKLPDVLAGKVQPADQREWLGFLQVCRFQQRHVATTTLAAAAFDADGRQADDLKAGHRYDAACAAALAGCGAGKDADKLKGKERADLRRQALTWLRADLEAWGRQLDRDPDKARAAVTVAKDLQHWLAETAFAGVRGPAALAKLPEDERQPWQKLWDDVADTLARVQRETPPEKKIDPRHATAHNNLGVALKNKGHLDAAIAEFRKAIALDPRCAPAYNNLGAALRAKRQWGAAIAEFRKAIELDPRYAPAYYNLGTALKAMGQLDGAIAGYRKAIALDPKDADFHGALGEALLSKGRFAEAKTSTETALKLLAKDHPMQPIVSRQLQQCQTQLALEAKLPDVLARKVQPADQREWLGLLEVCRLQQRYAAFATLAAVAFAADARLADDLKAGHRYDAACAAALAGRGAGKDADKLDEMEKARLRRQALKWLRADLEAWGRLLDKGPDKAHSAVTVTMALRYWLANTDFSAVGEPAVLARPEVPGLAALATLPEAERQEWQKFWDDVVDTLARAQRKTPPKKKSDAK